MFCARPLNWRMRYACSSWKFPRGDKRTPRQGPDAFPAFFSDDCVKGGAMTFSELDVGGCLRDGLHLWGAVDPFPRDAIPETLVEC